MLNMLGLYSLNGTAIVKVKNLEEKCGYIVQKGLWNVNKLIHIEPENKNITWLINIIYLYSNNKTGELMITRVSSY